MFPSLRLLAIVLVLFPAVLSGVACSDSGQNNANDGADNAATAVSTVTSGSGSAAERAAVEQTVRGAVDAYNRADLSAFLAAWTDHGLEDVTGSTRADLTQNPSDIFGGPPRQLQSFSNTSAGDTSASTEAQYTIGKAVGREKFLLVKESGAWKIDGTEQQQAALPDGSTKVDVKLDEFSFVFDKQQASHTNLAFAAKNNGDQQHELVLVKVAEDADVDALVKDAASASEPPTGVELIGGVGPIDAGESGNLVLAEPLAPGRYVMICFLPDTFDAELQPHALKGMYSEFNVVGQGGGR